MVEIKLITEDQKQSIGDFSNPFNKESVDRIAIYMWSTKAAYRDGKSMEAEIYFKNGKTKGNHAVYSDDIGDLLMKIKLFIDAL